MRHGLRRHLQPSAVQFVGRNQNAGPIRTLLEGNILGRQRRGDFLGVAGIQPGIKRLVIRLADQLHEDIQRGSHQHRSASQQHPLFSRESGQEVLALLHHLRE